MVRYDTLDFDDPVALRRAATIHISAPAAWDPEHRVTEAEIDHWAEAFSKSRDTDRHLMLVALDEGGAIVGFHWLKFEAEADPPCAHIHSLWVDPARRRRGVALELKARGEAWARARRPARMETAVAYDNQPMLALNQRLGFVAGHVKMSKAL